MDENFDRIADHLEVEWFRKSFPQLTMFQLVSILVNAALQLPALRDADEHSQNEFADGFALALARRLAAVDREWLN
jgi:hypothetical protein